MVHFMKKTTLDENFVNKSSLIREVLKSDPRLTNKGIKQEVFRRYGIKVGGNLICAAVGTQKSRARKAAHYPTIIAEAKKFLEKCGILSVDEGCYWIRAAGKA